MITPHIFKINIKYIKNRRRKILFRADGNAKIGLGHVYRCLAIAEYLENYFDIEFVASRNCTNIKKIIPWDYDLRILLEYDSVEEEAAYLAKQYSHQNVIYVVDGYQFTTEYLEIFKINNVPLVYIDDKHEIVIYADLIINHASGFSKQDFQTDNLTKICIGPEYAILRKTFLESERKTSFEFDVLICFGGADPNNYTMRILKDLPKELNVAVLVGRAYEHMEELKFEILGMRTAHFFSGLTSKELAELMEKSERSIMSASSVAYEYLTASAGQLYIIQTTENQIYLFQYLIQEGAAIEFNGYFDPDFVPKRINDGKSPERILKEFISLDLECRSRVLKVKYEDLNRTFILENEDIDKTNCLCYQIEFKEQLAGQIIFKLNDNEAEVKYFISTEFKNNGWEYRVLKLGIGQAISEMIGVKLISGYLKDEDFTHKNAYLDCNFEEKPIDKSSMTYEYSLSL